MAISTSVISSPSADDDVHRDIDVDGGGNSSGDWTHIDDAHREGIHDYRAS